MVIKPNRFLSYKCPVCNNLVFGSFSIFELTKNETKKIICDCEKSEFTITRPNKGYLFSVPCLSCEENHSMKLAFKTLWGKDNVLLFCSVSDFPICAIGNFDDVSKWADEYDAALESYFEDSEVEDYFSNANVMFQMIDLINRMSVDGDLSCDCGSLDIEVELTHDKVIIYCNNCGIKEEFRASTEQDLIDFIKLGAIKLKGNKNTKSAKIIEFKKK